MVVAHARLSHAAEGELGIDDMADGIVYRHAARGGVVEDGPYLSCVLAEDIQRQRLFRRVDAGDCVLEIVVWKDGQNGTEEFLLHACGALNVLGAEDGGSEKTRGIVPFSAEYNCIRILLQDPFETVHVAFIDDPSVVCIVADVLAVETAYGLAEGRKELVEDTFMDEYIIGCHAGLSRVHELSPGDALARYLQFCGLGDDDGALAAQFEGNGDEIFCRGAHDDLAHLNAACEEDLVKAAVQQLVVVLDSAVRAEDKLGRETVRDELFDDSGGVRRELGRA